MGTIGCYNCVSCSKSFETFTGMKLHISRYCSKPNDEIVNSNCAGPSSQVETGTLAVHSCEQNSDTNHYWSMFLLALRVFFPIHSMFLVGNCVIAER